ncbi:MAG: polysaccharide deacetylase [Actinomycetia bacterium]|nr:polysaccharide deacetylase [Actinomycetes bacterium]
MIANQPKRYRATYPSNVRYRDQVPRDVKGSATVAVLSYHKIGDPPEDGWESWYYVPTVVFRKQLQVLVEDGWHPIDHGSFVAALDDPAGLPDRSVLVTFDDGYQSLVAEAAPILEELVIPSVVFVPTAYIGGRNDFDAGDEPAETICGWDDLAWLAAHGMATQSHGVHHHAMSELDPAARRHEVEESQRVLTEGLGAPVRCFAFPYGDEGDDPPMMAAALRAAGYRAAFLYGGGATDLSRADRYRLPRIAMGPDTDLRALLG